MHAEYVKRNWCYKNLYENNVWSQMSRAKRAGSVVPSSAVASRMYSMFLLLHGWLENTYNFLFLLEWVCRSVAAHSFPVAAYDKRVAVGCDLGSRRPWDRVFDFRLGFNVRYCLFKVACDMRDLETIWSCIQRPVTRMYDILYLKENSLSCFYTFYSPPLPLYIEVYPGVSSPPFSLSVSLPPSLPPHFPNTHCTLPPLALYTHTLKFHFTAY
jgi:hypothetical protein